MCKRPHMHALTDFLTALCLTVDSGSLFSIHIWSYMIGITLATNRHQKCSGIMSISGTAACDTVKIFTCNWCQLRYHVAIAFFYLHIAALECHVIHREHSKVTNAWL